LLTLVFKKFFNNKNCFIENSLLLCYNLLFYNMAAIKKFVSGFKSIYQSFAKLLASKKLHLLKSFEFNSSFKQELAYNLNFVRYTTLELCCNEIKSNNVNGNVAELGVYKRGVCKTRKPVHLLQQTILLLRQFCVCFFRNRKAMLYNFIIEIKLFLLNHSLF
jgi:hypothetical protein